MRKKSRRNNVRRKSSRLFIGFLAWCFSFNAKGAENMPDEQGGARFSWNEHNKLSWSDFKGMPGNQGKESAAATCCSIGFRVGNNAVGHPEIVVYNTFYINKSWVKDDAKIESILMHEQGHFDLCELYTRKLKSLVASIDLSSYNVKQELMKVYAALSDEYEARQQAYEQETAHGTNLPEQQKWQEMITAELGQYSVA